MLRTTKNMKDKYEKIQEYLFSMIPEKWEEIYLYASVSTNPKKATSGEMYFYYLPKGILKKKYINVYEIPKRFNINEEQYLNIVKELYNIIKELKQDFIDTEQELWNSVTISIVDSKFKIEFNYDSLPVNEQESNARHIIWRYKHLKVGGEKKEERKILDNYFSQKRKYKKQVYEIEANMKTTDNLPQFNRESNTPKEVIIYEKENNEKQGEQSEEPDNAPKVKNQILSM